MSGPEIVDTLAAGVTGWMFGQITVDLWRSRRRRKAGKRTDVEALVYEMDRDLREVAGRAPTDPAPPTAPFTPAQERRIIELIKGAISLERPSRPRGTRSS